MILNVYFLMNLWCFLNFYLAWLFFELKTNKPNKSIYNLQTFFNTLLPTALEVIGYPLKVPPAAIQKAFTIFSTASCKK